MIDLVTIHGIKDTTDARGYASALKVPHRELHWADMAPAGYVCDVASYRGALRKRVVYRIAQQINFLRPRVVLAHSLGSVVMLDVIRWHGVRFKHLITIGSPLANSLYSDCRSGLPFGRLSWLNIYAEADLIAYPNLWSATPGDLLSSIAEFKRLGVRDEVIDGGNAWVAHSSYWAHATVQKRIEERLN